MDRNRLNTLADELMTLHGLRERGWRLVFRNFARRLGCCYFRHRLIALNDYYAEHNEERVVIDTLLHEIAHALVGPLARHGPVWKAMARRLGCIPKACGKNGLVLQPGRWKAKCPRCGRVFNYYRKPKYAAGYYCSPCGKEHGRLVFLAETNRQNDDAHPQCRPAP